VKFKKQNCGVAFVFVHLRYSAHFASLHSLGMSLFIYVLAWDARLISWSWTALLKTKRLKPKHNFNKHDTSNILV